MSNCEPRYYRRSVIDNMLAGYYTQAQIDQTLADYYTQAEIDQALAGYYTQAEIDQALAGYYTQTQVDQLLTGYSPAGHNHNGVYSLVGHNHDGVYSPDAHNHNGVYSPAIHNHDGSYYTEIEVDGIVTDHAVWGGHIAKIHKWTFVGNVSNLQPGSTWTQFAITGNVPFPSGGYYVHIQSTITLFIIPPPAGIDHVGVRMVDSLGLMSSYTSDVHADKTGFHQFPFLFRLDAVSLPYSTTVALQVMADDSQTAIYYNYDNIAIATFYSDVLQASY